MTEKKHRFRTFRFRRVQFPLIRHNQTLSSLILNISEIKRRAVIFRLGRLVKGGAKGPGLFLILPCVESYTKVDMRTVSFDVPPQEVLTKDSVTVAVDAVGNYAPHLFRYYLQRTQMHFLNRFCLVYYRVFNPVVSIANVENAQESTRLLAQTSLRNVLGTNSLAEILSNREAVSKCMREILDDATDVSRILLNYSLLRIRIYKL